MPPFGVAFLFISLDHLWSLCYNNFKKIKKRSGKMENLIYKKKNLKTTCNYKAHYDKSLDALHIFDRDLSETMTVTNAISKDFINFTLKKLELNKTPENILLYGTDGVVSEFNAEKSTFHFVPKDLIKKVGYKNFVHEMEERYQNN
jgi:hypothetical protein